MKVIIIILQAILNLVRKRRDLIANRSKIPPEYRDDVVVWYSPKKQRLINYDVIESYAEDFTNWAYRNTRGTAKITNNTIVITNVVETNNIVEDDNKPYSDLTIRVTGVTENKYLIVRQRRGKPETHIKKDGVYTFKDNNLYFGFGVSVIGECNITITQLPTSILKDFSGNGLDAYMYGFQGKLNSGVGIYAVDFTTYRKTSVITDVSHNTVKVVPAASNYLFIRYATTEMPAYTVNVQNLGNNVLTYQYATENGRREITLTEGINEIPESIKVDNPYQVGLRVNAGTGEITITQIPYYPNSLCYSGKETLIAYDIPLLTDFTVIAKRKWLNVNKGTFIVYGNPLSGGIENSAFGFEYINAGAQKLINTFGNSKILDNFYEGDISFMTPTNYNGNNKAKGSTPNTKNTLAIGNYTDTTQYGFIGCHDDIIILKRSLTINEINDITEAIFNETIIEE
jgi:hypothetical protein